MKSQTETNEKQSSQNFDVHRYFNQFTICSNILVMKQNLISIELLTEIMFNVFDKVEADMAHYEAMWSGLITSMNFRYKSANDLRSDIWIDCENDFKGDPEQMFLSEVNRKDITLEKFTRIAREFIEPMKVEKLLPHSLTPVNF